MAWLLLALHQLCLEDIAIAHPNLCGFTGVAPQTIMQQEHGYLVRIFTLAEGHPLHVKYLKVSSPGYLLADFG